MNVQGGVEIWLRGYPSEISDPTVHKGIPVDEIKNHIHTTQRITGPAFGAVGIHGQIVVQGDCLQVHVLVEPVWVGLPITHLHCADNYVWEAAPWILLSADLPEEPDCLPHHDSHEGPCWESSPRQTRFHWLPLLKASGESACGPRKGCILDELDPICFARLV